MVISILNSREDVIAALCNLIESTANTSIEKNGVFNIGVSGILSVFRTFYFGNIFQSIKKSHYCYY